MEKTSIEILESFAKERGINYTTNSYVKDFSLNHSERFISSKFIVFNLNSINKDLFFVFYDSFSPKAYASLTYSGLFKKISECYNEIKITKRYWFDLRKKLKSNDSYIDRKVTIIGDNDKIDRRIVNSGVIRSYIEIQELFPTLELETIRKSESIVPELTGNNFVAIKTNSWILEEKKLELLIKEGSKIFAEIN